SDHSDLAINSSSALARQLNAAKRSDLDARLHAVSGRLSRITRASMRRMKPIRLSFRSRSEVTGHEQQHIRTHSWSDATSEQCINGDPMPTRPGAHPLARTNSSPLAGFTTIESPVTNGIIVSSLMDMLNPPSLRRVESREGT